MNPLNPLFACSRCFKRYPFEEIFTTSNDDMFCKVSFRGFIEKILYKFFVTQTNSKFKLFFNTKKRIAVMQLRRTNVPIADQNIHRWSKKKWSFIQLRGLNLFCEILNFPANKRAAPVAQSALQILKCMESRELVPSAHCRPPSKPTSATGKKIKCRYRLDLCVDLKT